MIEYITGCMFCGKTEELLRRERIAGKEVVLFKPKIDDRYSENHVKTHDGINFKCFNVCSSNSLVDHIDNAEVIGIDEIQFFDDGILDVCKNYGLVKNKLLIVSGLNTDFRGEPFRFRDSDKHVGELMPLSRLSYLTAVCTYKNNEICGDIAEYTQRIVNEKPANYSDNLIVIGGKENYEARCKKHHFVVK